MLNSLFGGALGGVLGGNSADSTTGGGGADSFVNGALGMGQNSVGQAGSAADASMGQIQQSAAMTMKFQTEMALIQLMVKMNEAMAKMIKACGDAVKNLAG